MRENGALQRRVLIGFYVMSFNDKEDGYYGYTLISLTTANAFW